MSVRKDTLSHAYELMKVEDPRKRRRLAAQVASGQLSLVKLRERIEGRPPRPGDDGAAGTVPHPVARSAEVELPPPAAVPSGDDALQAAKAQLQEALAELVAVLRSPDFAQSASQSDRQNLAKYLTISKLTLENAITVVRGHGD